MMIRPRAYLVTSDLRTTSPYEIIGIHTGLFLFRRGLRNVPRTAKPRRKKVLMTTALPNKQNLTLTNTNKWDTRQLVTMALMCAISVLLSFIEFPLLPGVAWLKYDASAMPALVSGFAFGPAAGLAVGVVSAVIHGILMADFAGAIMTILVVIGFVLPAAFIYRRKRTLGRAALGLVFSIVGATVMAILGNLVITPLYLGVPFDAVVDMIIPILTPFNLIKAVLNGVLTLIIYKSVSNLITPKKKQVKGR